MLKVCALTKRDGPAALELGFTNSFRGNIDNDRQWYSNAPNANTGVSYEEVVNEDFQFDMDAHDVMVFLHIQKTGGTSFGKHLVMDLDLKVKKKHFHIS